MSIDYRCAFTSDGWDPAAWLLVKRADWDHYGQWTQGNGFIENQTPPAADPTELAWNPEEGLEFAGSPMLGTHAGMVYRQSLTGDFLVAATLAFTGRMAPSIVLGTLTDSARSTHRQYRESWEVVVWDEGINVWQQSLPDGRVQWDLLGYLKLVLQPDIRYVLNVRREAQTLHVRLDEHCFGLHVPQLPASCYTGITGCEGVNRFYDFRVEQTTGV